MNGTQKPVGPIDVAAFIARMDAGDVPERVQSVEIFLNPQAAADCDRIEQELRQLADRQPDEVGVSEVEPVSARRAELEAEWDEKAQEFEDSKATFSFRGERIGDFAALNKMMEDDGVNPEDFELKSAYRIALHSVDPVLTGQQVVKLMPVIGTEQMLMLVGACDAVLRAPAPLSRRPSVGRATRTH